jgi:hypothetical protein
MTILQHVSMTNARSSARSDRGEATTQLVILTPLLVLLVFLGVQAAIYFHAANVASAAAAQGAAAASSVSGSKSAIDVAQSTVTDLGSRLAQAPTLSVSAGYVSVSVSLSVPRIVPFFPSSVTRTAIEPRERFVPESSR